MLSQRKNLQFDNDFHRTESGPKKKLPEHTLPFTDVGCKALNSIRTIGVVSFFIAGISTFITLVSLNCITNHSHYLKENGMKEKVP
jgi:hypothetical protein